MITRTYDILMPTSDGVNLDIPVEGLTAWGAVGGRGPVTTVGDGFYNEWRNRPIRIPTRAGTVAQAAAGFAPRFRLGFGYSIVARETGAAPLLTPRLLFSRSLVGDVFTTVGSATTAGDSALADDVTDGAIIRVLNGAGITAVLFRLSLFINEAMDEGASAQTS